jgi:hypothetical protein
MKPIYVNDERIPEGSAFRVIEHPQYAGYYGCLDTDFMSVEFASYNLEEVIELAVEQNRAWNDFIEDLGL